MENLIAFLNSIKFGPEFGDWSGALVSILFGGVSFLASAISAIFIYFKWIKESKENRKEQERLRKAEEEQTYITLRIRYDDIWAKLTDKGQRHLYMSYKDNKDLTEFFSNDKNEVARIKTIVWQLINHLSDIEFFYCQKQDTLYWKRWDVIFRYVFSKPLIKQAFIKNKKQFEHNTSFVELVDKIIIEDLEKYTRKK